MAWYWSETLAHAISRNKVRQIIYLKHWPKKRIRFLKTRVASVKPREFRDSSIWLLIYSIVFVMNILFFSCLFPPQIQIPLISVTSITKEKTAKFIPNAVAVSTVDDTQTFTSLISRDATFKAMTKSWKKAITKNNLANMVSTVEDRDWKYNSIFLQGIFKNVLKAN